MAAELKRWGIENSRVVPRGVDTTLFDPCKRSRELRCSWGADDSTLVLLYVGRIAAEKNLDLALTAFHRIKAQGQPCCFVLVGDGPCVDRLREKDPEPKFVGAKRGEELAACYASADLFLFPSLTETFGNVVLEAMASGLPVLAYDYAAAALHVSPHRNGELVRPGDGQGFSRSACKLARDRERLRALGANARRTAECIGWEEVVGLLERVLIDTINPDFGGKDHANIHKALE